MVLGYPPLLSGPLSSTSEGKTPLDLCESQEAKSLIRGYLKVQGHSESHLWSRGVGMGLSLGESHGQIGPSMLQQRPGEALVDSEPPAKKTLTE